MTITSFAKLPYSKPVSHFCVFINPQMPAYTAICAVGDAHCQSLAGAISYLPVYAMFLLLQATCLD